jgi:hypothetical protein
VRTGASSLARLASGQASEEDDVLRVVVPFLVTAVVVLIAVLGTQSFVRGVRRRERVYLQDLYSARAALDQVRSELLASPMPYEPQVLTSIEVIDAELARPIQS